MIFQSTPPVKAATSSRVRSTDSYIISIHAAREGGDVPANSLFFGKRLFQSTPPVKAATLLRHWIKVNWRFQSTPPVKAATPELALLFHVPNISIHAAREGGDHCHSADQLQGSSFQSTPPVKAATVSFIIVFCLSKFQSTPPVKAATTTRVSEYYI